MSRPTRILILGGGFGGVYTVFTLEKLLTREIQCGAVELGLVSRENTSSVWSTARAFVAQTARTVALRGRSLTSAISPKHSPGPSRRSDGMRP